MKRRKSLWFMYLKVWGRIWLWVQQNPGLTQYNYGFGSHSTCLWLALFCNQCLFTWQACICHVKLLFPQPYLYLKKNLSLYKATDLFITEISWMALTISRHSPKCFPNMNSFTPYDYCPHFIHEGRSFLELPPLWSVHSSVCVCVLGLLVHT